MICAKCCENKHEDCRGGNWCDCGRQVSPAPEPKGTPVS